MLNCCDLVGMECGREESLDGGGYFNGDSSDKAVSVRIGLKYVQES